MVNKICTRTQQKHLWIEKMFTIIIEIFTFVERIPQIMCAQITESKNIFFEQDIIIIQMHVCLFIFWWRLNLFFEFGIILFKDFYFFTLYHTKIINLVTGQRHRLKGLNWKFILKINFINIDLKKKSHVIEKVAWFFKSENHVSI